MKKYIMLIFILIVCLLGIFIPMYNNYLARQLTSELLAIPLPKNTKYIDSISAAGKLTGNGNGMQYYGAILIKSELSLEKLEIYYNNYRENGWKCLVEVQKDKNIKMIDHGEYSFVKEVDDNDFYIVYSWGSVNSILNELDIRGH